MVPKGSINVHHSEESDLTKPYTIKTWILLYVYEYIQRRKGKWPRGTDIKTTAKCEASQFRRKTIEQELRRLVKGGLLQVEKSEQPHQESNRYCLTEAGEKEIKKACIDERLRADLFRETTRAWDVLEGNDESRGERVYIVESFGTIGTVILVDGQILSSEDVMRIYSCIASKSPPLIAE